MKSLRDMTDDEIEELVTSLRSRRTEAETKLKLHIAARTHAKGASLKERLARQIELAEKDLKAINTKLEKLEGRINSIIALRLQHGDLALDDLADVAIASREEEVNEV